MIVNMKAAGAEPSGQMRDQQLHTAVARSALGSEHVKNTSGSDGFGPFDLLKKHSWLWGKTKLRSRSTIGS